MRIRQAVAGTHAGAVRTFNEDAVLRLGRVPLYAIADGMGGPDAGDVAAQLSLDVVKRHAMTIRDHNIALTRERSAEHRRALQRSLDSVFNRASQQIREEAARRGKSVMGASLVLCTIADEYAYIAHVGDARAYLVRGGTLQRLTEDHTLAELKLRRGRITRAEYENHPERHVLYQSLGAPFELDVDLAEVRLEDGDILLLCSDDVVGSLDDAQISSGLDPWDLNGSLRGLLRACIQARCTDNISAVMLGMEGETKTEVVPKVDPEALADDDPPTTPDVVETPSFDVRGTLFQDLDEAQRTALAPYLEERTFNAGDRLFAVGDPADVAHVVVGGRAFLTCHGLPIGEVADGVISAIAFDGRGLSELEAVAKAPTTTLCLTRRRFEDLLVEKPALAARIAMGLSDAQGRLGRTLASRLEAVEAALKGKG